MFIRCASRLHGQNAHRRRLQAITSWPLKPAPTGSAPIHQPLWRSARLHRCASMLPAILLLLLPRVLQTMQGSFALVSTSPFSNDTTTDREALLQFKASLSQQSAPLVTWNTTSDFCHWPGVICSLRHRGRVSALNLSSAGLVGTISPSIGNMTFLKILDLSFNMLQGSRRPSGPFGGCSISISRGTHFMVGSQMD
ncbi:hypothetical protein BS78_05G122200 [Paspalum vaginatum]|nr:hypothetical protein BS78_05G122200 [Paspalum vaginatum]